jgi:Flp pilus assembly CpaF family ATPase
VTIVPLPSPGPADEDHARRAASESFHRRLAPLLSVATDPERFPHLTDVFVDGERIVIAQGSHRQGFAYADFPGPSGLPGLSPAVVQAAMRNAAVYKDVEFGPGRPRFSVRMPPDLRVTCARPAIAETWHLSIRFLRARELTLDDYVRDGVMDEAQRDAIRALVRERRNVLVSGGTGSGKTTLLRAMLREVDTSPAGERLLVIEDTAELALPGAIHYEADEASKTTLADLVMLAMRSQPDRIVLGEVRGTEAIHLIEAMNTGHAGTICTVHSNGGRAALRRLHLLARRAIPGFLMEEIEDAIDAVVQIGVEDGKRRLSGVWHVRGN